jgi:NAD+ synthase (glutamine-hydrolysing)
MKRSFNITVAQAASTPGDIESNFEVAKNWVQKNKSADLIVFAQSFLTGGGNFDMHKKYPVLLKKSKEYLKKLAPFTKGINVLIGNADEIAFLSDGKIEKTIVNSGIIKIEDKSIAVFEGKSFEKEVSLKSAVDCAIVCYSTTTRVGEECKKNKIFSEFARKISTPSIFVNAIGAIDCLTYEGASRMYGKDGKLLGCAKFLEEDEFKIDLNNLRNCTIDPLINDFQYCGEKFSLDYSKDLKRTYLVTIKSVQEYFYKNGFKKAVLGVSGGIDSALVACIAADAMGKDNVAAVTMPSMYTKEETRADAIAVAKHLGLKVITIPINVLYQSYMRLLKKEFKDAKPNIAEENLQARIRGNMLMALSNKFDWLVLTTGNKSEMSTGYCTLYGDMAGGFAVLKDVPKMTVYQLAEYRNAVARKEIIPVTTIKRPPTAELRPNQKDQDSLPPYHLLDAILKLYVEEDRSANEIVAQRFDPKVVKKVINMVDKNEYKRRQSPPGVKITPKAFGRDRRIPITNRY